MGYIDARADFPVCRNLIYLNHAAVAPLSRPAAAAMSAVVEQTAQWGSLRYEEWMACYEGLRSAAARLIAAQPQEIAIVKNTSEGISTVALGLHWTPGDRIVIFHEEFPANYYPWLRLEAKGVTITRLSIHDPLETIAAAIPGAKLLAISFVNYLSGFRTNLPAIGKLCRDHRCFFFVDAIQGLGAYPLDVERSCIDALAADGHKWLLGPEGNGILYIRREWQDRIEPAEFGWTNSAAYADYSSRDMALRPDAGRYECGTLNTVGCFGLRAAIEYLLEIGIKQVSQQVDSLAQQIEDGVRSKGYQVLIHRTPETGSGIVSFRHATIDARKIVSDLKHGNVLAIARQGWIRTSPHFYLNSDDINRFLTLLP